MKKLYMFKLGLLVMLVCWPFMQVDALETHNSYSVNNNTHLVINDDVIVTGNLSIGNNGSLTIKGTLEVGGKITVGSGAYLIVYGNLKSTSNQDIQIDGSILVAGNLDITYGADIKNNGNLIVGGDFIQAGGTIDFTGKESNLRIYILNPDAYVDVPEGSVVNDPAKVGDLEDFRETEVSDSVLTNFVEQVIVDQVIGFQWKIDNINSNWLEDANWTGNRKPRPDSNVRIRPSTTNPDIDFEDEVIEINNLTIEEGAVLTLKPGAKLTVNGVLTIKEEGGLVMENTTEIDGLSSLITKGEVVGKARIALVFPRDEWYYVSQPIKEAKSDIYALLDSEGAFRTSEAWVNIHRANRWYRIATGVAIAKLEGLSIKYRVADENEEANHSVSYTGELNNDPIFREFPNNQYYLFGNPFASAINWQETTGWLRNNIGGTIYYRARVNGFMTFVTYNRLIDDEMARAAVFPDGVEYGDIAELASIPPLQSVWISSLGEGSITIDNDARQHVAAGSLLKSSRGGSNSSVIRIRATSEYGADGAVLYFSENSDEGLDRGDSEKMFNDALGIPEIFTRVGDKAMAINGLPLIQESSRTIPISVRNRVEGEVALSFDMRAYDGAHAPYLEDRETGAFINLLQDNSYTYTIGATGENHDRFVLHFYFVTTDLESPREDEIDAGADIKIKSIADKVLVSMSPELLQSGDALVEIYTIEGRKVGAVPARSSRTLLFLPSERGIYIIRALAGSIVKSERVVKSGN